MYRLVIFSVWCYFKTFYSFRVYGKDHYKEGGAIIASNHVSYYDPPLLAITWFGEVHFLARNTLFKGLFGKFIKKINSHPIKRNTAGLSAIKMITGLLKEGKKVIIFPEGRRTDTDKTGPLKKGIALLLTQSKTAIIPTYIYGMHRIWNRKRKFPKIGGKIACIFGTPIEAKDFENSERKKTHAAIIEKLASSLEALEKWYKEGAKGTPP